MLCIRDSGRPVLMVGAVVGFFRILPGLHVQVLLTVGRPYFWGRVLVLPKKNGTLQKRGAGLAKSSGKVPSQNTAFGGNK